MLARIHSDFNCTADQLWKLLRRPSSLQFVAAPILVFRPLPGTEFGEEWDPNHVYSMKLYFLGVLPLGKHQLRIARLDAGSMTIASEEQGTLARQWNHELRLSEIGPGLVRYEDEIAIQAGWLTPMVWLFAQFFYRHRHRRWRLLLRKAS